LSIDVIGVFLYWILMFCAQTTEVHNPKTSKKIAVLVHKFTKCFFIRKSPLGLPV